MSSPAFGASVQLENALSFAYAVADTKMRQLAVTVPCDREEMVLEILQNECELKNLTRRTDGITTTFFGYVTAQVRTKCCVIIQAVQGK